MEYIVVRCPSPYLGKPINVAFYVVNRTQLARCIDDYLDNKYKRTDEYGAIQVFKKLIVGKKPRLYKDAVRHCNYLNGNLRKYDANCKTKGGTLETKRQCISCSPLC